MARDDNLFASLQSIVLRCPIDLRQPPKRRVVGYCERVSPIDLSQCPKGHSVSSGEHLQRISGVGHDRQAAVPEFN